MLKTIIFVSTLVAISLGLTASSAVANNEPVTGDTQTCEASWYGKDFQGNDMANGEEFDMNDPTVVAHKDYPFGTTLIITNERNKRAIVVEVQDRGPFVPGRCVDLSRAGARALDYYVNESAGTTDVLVEVCESNCPPAGTLIVPVEDSEQSDVTSRTTDIIITP